MKSALKLIFITLPILAIGVGFLAYTVSNRAGPEQNPLAERATPVRVVTAAETSLAPRITGYGLVRPSHVYEAIAQVGGTAEYVNPGLKKGAILPAGTVLLRLSQADFNLAVAQARANIRAAEARLDELEVSEKNQIAALDIERKALEIKQNDLERVKKLVARGTSSQAAQDAAQAAWLAQRQKVLNLENALALLPTQRQVQREQIAVYQTSLETAQLNLERTTLTLPFTARVAQTSVEIGQFVRVGQVAAILDGVDSAEVEAQVSIADMLALLHASLPEGGRPDMNPDALSGFLRDMGLGAVVRLRLGEQALVWQAQVVRISDTIDQVSGTLGVIVRIDSAYSGAAPGKRPPLTKGMFVEVTLSGPLLTGIVIPRSALRNGKVLLAESDDRLATVPVSPRLLQDEVVLVTDGLSPGDRVVVSAPSPAIPGMLLEVTEDSALAARLAGMEPAQ